MAAHAAPQNAGGAQPQAPASRASAGQLNCTNVRYVTSFDQYILVLSSSSDFTTMETVARCIALRASSMQPVSST